MSCSVCIESFNRSTRKKIQCPYCEYDVCKECVEHYLLDSTQDAHCMSCRKGWNRELLDSLFTKSFISGAFKKHREDVLYQREQSLLPATQPYAEREKERHHYKEALKRALAELRVLKQQPMPLLGTPEWHASNRLAIKLQCDIIKYKNELDRRRHRESQQNKHSEKRTFVRCCPAPDCRGFLAEDWKCGMCDGRSCNKCHEYIGKELAAPHTCKPENIETAKLLSKDTRHCPSCAAPIFKIDGCDQMYCMQCHTPFSWKTGQIETGAIHNPHYYEYMRTHGGNAPRRQPGDFGGCGALLPDYSQILRSVRKVWPEVNVTELGKIVQNYYHIREVTLPMYQRAQGEEGEANNRDLRVRFLLKEIDERHFKQLLHKREKAKMFKQELFQVTNMYQVVLTDILLRLTRSKKASEAVEVWSEIQQLRNYVNESYEKLHQRYNCKVPVLA